jgi:malonate transporter
MENLLFSINSVVPIFVMVFFGILFKKRGIINDNFTSVSSDIVFKIALPALLFKDVASTDLKSVFDIKLILFSLVGTIILFFVLCAICPLFIDCSRTKGAFIQGVFRSNYAILGIPLAYNIFGQAGLTKSAILMAFVIPVYNVLAVIILTVTSNNTTSINNKKDILINIISNPLIISIVAALPFSYLQIQLPQIVVKVIDYFSALAIPLALLGIGGSFTFNSIKKNFSLGLFATVLKIVVVPAVFTTLAFYMGFRGIELGVLFILFASPTAVSSFIMAKAMDSNSGLAANIILMTTLGSVFTIFLGVYILKTVGAI